MHRWPELERIDKGRGWKLGWLRDVAIMARTKVEMRGIKPEYTRMNVSGESRVESKEKIIHRMRLG
jgi:hypothetical protein